MDFYRIWEIINPSKKMFNKSLNDFMQKFKKFIVKKCLLLI